MNKVAENQYWRMLKSQLMNILSFEFQGLKIIKKFKKFY